MPPALGVRAHGESMRQTLGHQVDHLLRPMSRSADTTGVIFRFVTTVVFVSCASRSGVTLSRGTNRTTESADRSRFAVTGTKNTWRQYFELVRTSSSTPARCWERKSDTFTGSRACALRSDSSEPSLLKPLNCSGTANSLPERGLLAELGDQEFLEVEQHRLCLACDLRVERRQVAMRYLVPQFQEEVEVRPDGSMLIIPPAPSARVPTCSRTFARPSINSWAPLVSRA